MVNFFAKAIWRSPIMKRPTVNNSRPPMTNTPMPASLAGVATPLTSTFGSHEGLDERVVAAIEVVDAPLRNDAAVVEQRQLVADRSSARNVVRHDHQCG